MSYIPDYRCDENEQYLNKEDMAYLDGYRKGLEDAKTWNEERESGFSMIDNFDEYADICDRETTCFVFYDADYIPEDVELKDMNRYWTKAELEGEQK